MCIRDSLRESLPSLEAFASLSMIHMRLFMPRRLPVWRGKGCVCGGLGSARSTDPCSTGPLRAVLLRCVQYCFAAH
eukprot:1928693-Rhodomonas_salina.1